MTTIRNAFDLTGRVAVVTGAGSGIGEATAKILAEAGAAVVAADIDADASAATAEAIVRAGGTALAHRADVARRGDHDTLAAAAVERFGGLHIWCNVAGIADDSTIEEVSEERLDHVLGVNLKGVLFGCQAAMAVMRPARDGVIVNVSSTGIDVPVAGNGVYALSKAAVAMLTMTLAVEAGPYGIRVNATAPGATVTNFSMRHLIGPDGRRDEAAFEAFLARMAGLSPLGIVGDATDQALQILYLVSPAARYVTGNIFRANGGQSMVW